MKISITRALAEIKLLDARIKKEIAESEFVDVHQKRKNFTLQTHMTKEEFERHVKANYESIIDLIERRKKIKSAILISNATAKVKIAGIEYTVIEAIERKASINYENNLLKKMKMNNLGVNNRIDEFRAKLDADVQKMLEQNLGSDQKTDKDAFEKIAKPFFESNELNKVDPILIDKRIDELDKKIDEFLTEVDFVLSESNSKTEIEI